MKNKKDLKSKKIKTIKLILYTLIGIGILIVIYLLYTNFITTGRETYYKKVEVEENYDIVDKKDITEKITESSKDHDRDEEVYIKEESDYENLKIEDFFPLKISIPKIEVEAIVEEGTDRESLKNGPGYEALTPLPGDVGRCTISGHRSTYNATFNRLDELENGDLIYLETINDELLAYVVTGMEIVRATDVWILEGTEKRELVLTTCHPKYSAARRLVIITELMEIFPFEMTRKG